MKIEYLAVGRPLAEDVGHGLKLRSDHGGQFVAEDYQRISAMAIEPGPRSAPTSSAPSMAAQPSMRHFKTVDRVLPGAPATLVGAIASIFLMSSWCRFSVVPCRRLRQPVTKAL